MFTKADIEREKLKQDTPFFKKVLEPNNEEQILLSTLKSLGKLPKGFDGQLFVPLLEHQNPKIRCLAIKNLGKLKDVKYLTTLIVFAETEKNTATRREAVSAIGRLKTESTIPVLRTFTEDADPKIILQALRGLLYFKEHPDVKKTITSLATHPNEIIREQIERDTGHAVPPKTAKTKNHIFSPDPLKNLMVCADVQDVMKVIPDESIHLTFTSPPYYNARDYTIFQSYNAYLDFLSDVFTETHRITKEGRFFVLNTSPVIVPRISRAHASKRYAIPYDIHPRLTEMGWEFIDDIVWMKPEYAAKNRNGGFFQHRKPLGYKANSITESVMVYRKKTDRLIDWNIRQYDDETIDASTVSGEYEKTNVWQINPATDKVHPAIFPPELASRVIQFYSFKGDLVFDPFGGSGTVGYVALIHERNYLLCEKEVDYVSQAEKKLDAALFPTLKPRFLSLEELQRDMAERN